MTKYKRIKFQDKRGKWHSLIVIFVYEHGGVRIIKQEDVYD